MNDQSIVLNELRLMHERSRLDIPIALIVADKFHLNAWDDWLNRLFRHADSNEMSKTYAAGFAPQSPELATADSERRSPIVDAPWDGIRHAEFTHIERNTGQSETECLAWYMMSTQDRDAIQSRWKQFESFLEKYGISPPFMHDWFPRDEDLFTDVIYFTCTQDGANLVLQSRCKNPNGQIQRRSIRNWISQDWDVLNESIRPPRVFRYALIVPNLFLAVVRWLSETAGGEGRSHLNGSFVAAISKAAESDLQGVQKVRYLQYLLALLHCDSGTDEQLRGKMFPFKQAYTELTKAYEGDSNSMISQNDLDAFKEKHGRLVMNLAKQEAWLKAVRKAESLLRTSHSELQIPERKASHRNRAAETPRSAIRPDEQDYPSNDRWD